MTADLDETHWCQSLKRINELKGIIMLIIEQVTDTHLGQLQAGDKLLRYNGVELRDEQTLKHAIWRSQVDHSQSATLRLIRNGQQLEVEVPTGRLGLIFQPPIQDEEVVANPDAVPEKQPDSLSAKDINAPLQAEPTASRQVPPAVEHYKTARMVCAFVSFFGWIPVVLGLIVIVLSFSSDMGLMGILIASSPIVVGLLMVMFAQVAVAILDIADNSRETRRMTALMLQNKE